MRAERRQSILRFAERAALALAVCDLLLFLAVARPFQARVASAEEAYNRLRQATGDQENRVAELERVKARLPEAGANLQDFLRDEVPARRWCFSTVDRLVRKLTEQAQVELSDVSPRLVANKNEPLEHLSLEIAVDGPFDKVLNFVHDVETAGNLLVIRNFSIVADEGNTLSLKIGTDLYLTP